MKVAKHIVCFVFLNIGRHPVKDGLEEGRNGVGKFRNRICSKVLVSKNDPVHCVHRSEWNRESRLTCNRKYKRNPLSVKIC